MPTGSPPIDTRTFDDIVQATTQLAAAYTGYRPKAATSPDLGFALIRVFGRMATQALDRLNRVPDRSFLAFLGLIGVEPKPPRPARALLTFDLVTGGTTCPLVPAGTRVGAQPAPGDPGDVSFETTDDLVTTRAALASVVVHQPDADRWSYASNQPGGQAYPAFVGDTAIEHSLFIAAAEVLALPAGTPITLSIKLAAADMQRWLDLSTKPLGAPLLEWSYSNGGAWIPLPGLSIPAPSAPDTFVLAFNAPGPVAPSAINGTSACWLRAKLRAFPDSGVPAIGSFTLSAPVTATGRAPEVVCWNGLALDMSKDFFPLGEQPRFNDTFYIASQEILGRPGAKVTLNLSPSEGSAALTLNDDPILVWEVWAGGTWREIGRSTRAIVIKDAMPPAAVITLKGDGFSDTTAALKTAGSVSFTIPPDVAPVAVQGRLSSWVRVRLLGGKNRYGLGISLTAATPPVVFDDGYRPPILKSLTLDISHTLSVSPASVITRSNFAFSDRSADAAPGFLPFVRSTESRPALYIGFDQPFEARTMTLYAQVAPLSPGALTGGAPLSPAEVMWEYLSPSGWTSLGATDGTQAFSRSGLVQFIGPADLAPKTLYGLSRCWLRARWKLGDFPAPPRIGRISTNTTWATHTITIRGEVLSAGADGEGFVLGSTPILAGEVIEVEEAEGTWVRWQAVTDFHASGPGDRHYTIDRTHGSIRFGDGRRGMAPPLGVGSIRAAFYQIGGGALGNRPSGTINSLKTAVPYIDTVTNHEPATGGADADEINDLLDKGPRILRHGHRAIAGEDFEDLAFEASPLVARAKAITPYFDPLSQTNMPGGVGDAGKVGLILVAQGAEPRPAPSLGLIQDVQTYLQARCSPTVSLRVSGPDWIEVTVAVKIVPASVQGADALRVAVKAALLRFLHPLSGGVDGSGWDFGRIPHASDLYPLLMAIPGVGYVRALTLTLTRPGDLSIDGASAPVGPTFDPSAAGNALDRALVFAGPPTVDILTPEEAPSLYADQAP